MIIQKVILEEPQLILRFLHKEQGSWRKLAKKLDINIASLHRIASGKVLPHYVNYEKMSIAYNEVVDKINNSSLPTD